MSSSIPDHDTWTVTMWHFGSDSLNDMLINRIFPDYKFKFSVISTIILPIAPIIQNKIIEVQDKANFWRCTVYCLAERIEELVQQPINLIEKQNLKHKSTENHYSSQISIYRE
jgi:hypothetical protein